MHPLYRYRFEQRHQPPDPQIVDAPMPWRTIRYLSELDEILDANGFTIAVCRPEHAARIVEAVNGVEKAS